MTSYVNKYGTEFAVQKHDGAPALMCKAKGADSWTLSGVLAAVQGEAYTASDLQEVLDEYARAHSWKKGAPEQVKADFSPCESCRCPDCDDEACLQAHCDKSDKGLGCIAPDDDCPPQNPTAAAPASPADAGAATQSLSAAGPASLEAPLSASSAFDYSGLDAQTVQDLHLAEREFAGGKRMAEIGLRRMADGVAIAHDALCGSCDIMSQLKHGNRGEASFGRWCDSVGLNRKAAERLLQVSKLFDNSCPRQQKALEELGPTLLYAAAKPSAPAELVQAVKAGDITTHKQYQELLAKLKDEQAARKEAEKKVKGLADSYATAHKNEEFSIRNLKKAKQERDEAIKERDGARDALKAVKMRADKWQAEAEAARAKPIEAKVVDEAEVNRRAQELADKQTADLRQRLADLQAAPSGAEDASRDAYDAVVYTCRTIENSWKAVKPLLQRMAPDTLPMAVNQLATVLHNIENEVRTCL